MWDHARIKRLADKSAFVVFDTLSYKTYVVQTQFIFDLFTRQESRYSKDEFELLNEAEQIKVLISLGIEKELH